MVTIECPWCLEDEALPFLDVADSDGPFTCPGCGTTVTFAAEVALDVEWAA